jgi:hypothetical protein
VLSLNVNKAEFRTSLGPFGAVMIIATKWFMPGMFAALVFGVSSSGWTGPRRVLVAMAAIGVGIVGASWGFKTTILSMLLPSFVLVYWKIRLRTLILQTVLVMGLVVTLGLYFDRGEDTQATINALLLRVTALQGDLAWYTWDKVNSGFATPAYFRTFIPVLGDRFLALMTGASSTKDYAEWATYYFGPAMTLYGGYPVSGMEAGVSTQPTMFAETLVIGGKYFYWVFSALFGAVIGGIAVGIKQAILSRRVDVAATLATFYSITVLSWTLGNGFASLFFLINVVGSLSTFWAISMFFRRRFPPKESAYA